MLVTITKPNPTNKDLDIAIKKLNKMVKDSNILEELKKREVYYKPSLKAKMKRNEARKRRIRDENKEKAKERRRMNGYYQD
jgi:ribosomal protein S21